MGQVDGLIIPRSYNDYFSRSDPQAIREIVATYTDDELDTTSELPVQNKVIAEIVPSSAAANNKLATAGDVSPKQNKTLDTPIHLEGQDYTTVEGALGALAGAGGNSSVNRYTTLAAAQAALAIPEGSAGYLGDNAIVIVDEINPYIEGEERATPTAQSEETTEESDEPEETPAEEESAEEEETPAEDENADEENGGEE
jgi:hypothetical protein